MRRIIPCHALLLGITALVLQAPAQPASVPVWGAKTSVPIGTPIDELKKGQFLWMGEAVASGPMVMVVSLNEQRAYVYRNGVLIGATTVSTGRPGHLTPTGVFTVLQKQKEHRSTIYDGAPMPYMERLTWGGVALHAGGLPGYPESRATPRSRSVSITPAISLQSALRAATRLLVSRWHPASSSAGNPSSLRADP